MALAMGRATAVLVTGRGKGAKAVLVAYALTRRCQPTHALQPMSFDSAQLRSMHNSTPAAINNTNTSAATNASACTDSSNTTATTDTTATCSTHGVDSRSPPASYTRAERVELELEKSSLPKTEADESENAKRLSNSRAITNKHDANAGYSRAMPTATASGNKKGLKELLGEFTQGMKLLWREIGLAREINSRRKAGHQLSFQEQRLLRQVTIVTT